MPLGLPRRSYESRPSTSPLSSVVIDSDADSGDNGNRGPEKHRRTDHHRSASWNDAAPRPRGAFPIPGPLFKNLPTFYHDHHRRSQHMPGVDMYADKNLDSDSTTPPQHLVNSTDPFVISPQGQPHHHHQSSRLLGFFTHSTTANHGKGSSPPKSQPPNVSSKEDSFTQLRSEVTSNRDISSGNMTSVASSTTLNKGHTTSPSKVCLPRPAASLLPIANTAAALFDAHLRRKTSHKGDASTRYTSWPQSFPQSIPVVWSVDFHTCSSFYFSICCHSCSQCVT